MTQLREETHLNTSEYLDFTQSSVYICISEFIIKVKISQRH